MLKRLALAALLLTGLAAPALAVRPDEMLKDPGLEARARALSAQLRCMVCQNENIDDSEADLARDLRLLVREHLTRGETDQQVLDFLVARYGRFVLLKPRLELQTLLLWGVPVVVLVLGAGAAIIGLRRSRLTAGDAPLSGEEEARLAVLLDDGDVKG